MCHGGCVKGRQVNKKCQTCIVANATTWTATPKGYRATCMMCEAIESAHAWRGHRFTESSSAADQRAVSVPKNTRSGGRVSILPGDPADSSERGDE